MNTITGKHFKKLVLQASAAGVSFCVLDTLNSEIKQVSHIPFSKTVPLEDELWRTFVQYPELRLGFDEAIVLHDNAFNALVPTALFDENFAGSYLQYNTRVFEGDAYAWDNLASYDITNVYVPLMNINNYLVDRLGAFEYRNANSILVEKLLDASKNSFEKQVFVHIQPTHFEIVVSYGQKLLLFNSFEYASAEDFLYYLLFTIEQLELNPETIKVALLGNIDIESPLYTLAYTYMRNVALYDATALAAKWQTNQKDALTNFILLNA
ncbi:DUF3822 family protein [Flavobacterium sp. RHBU_3]|uniref:DUF3822 family protein n=1 Tax=Flavobacterium sp. RHBU_3 TaxID=3391184 RepID=UPI003984C623